jgi:hypothetical protein
MPQDPFEKAERAHAPSWRSVGDLQHELFPDLGEEDTPPSLGFVTRLIVATTLPHSEPAGNEFIRNSGLYDLCLLAPSIVGLPYGIYPRLALAAWATEAVQRRTPYLPLTSTFANFAWRLGITPSTGPRGTLTHLREQLHRLANLSVSSHEDPAAAVEQGLPAAFRGGGVRLVKKYNFWWDEPDPEELLPNYVRLSQDFYEELIAHPIPVSLDVMRSFRSPLAIDVYMWLTYRSIRSQRIGRPEPVSWAALKRQFGANYSELRTFRFHFLRALKAVRNVYPDCRVATSRICLFLSPYLPHISRTRKIR